MPIDSSAAAVILGGNELFGDRSVVKLGPPSIIRSASGVYLCAMLLMCTMWSDTPETAASAITSCNDSTMPGTALPASRM